MRPRLFVFACLLALGLTACGAEDPAAPAAEPYKDPGLYAGTTMKRGGLKLPARIQGRDLALGYKGKFAARFWPGVNLGVTVPGGSPGELAPTRRDYDRWLDGMQDLGARVVRVYTILRPAFYDALAAHNQRNPRTPLYFIQGVWIPGEEFIAAQDAYPTTAAFDEEIADAVDVVHGDASLPMRRGHAGGRYTADVARWLLDISALRWGTANPKASRFDDRVTVAGGGKTVELRIPWAMLTFSDPSSRQVWVPKADGSVDTLKVDRLGIDVAPAGGAAVSTNGYGWDEWNDFHERRTAGQLALRRSCQSTRFHSSQP
jgi:hypothetical protein